jgi:hypothetical protein
MEDFQCVTSEKSLSSSYLSTLSVVDGILFRQKWREVALLQMRLGKQGMKLKSLVFLIQSDSTQRYPKHVKLNRIEAWKSNI